MTKIIGHTRQKELITRLLKADKLPNAMMFAGIEGIGKLLVARELARSLFCETDKYTLGGCLKCKSCHLFDSGNFPDYQQLNCLEKADSEIDRFRELLHSLHMRTFAGGSRVVVISNADHLSIEASNLLLKSLEEPRPGNYFILISTNPRTLPQTLLSRCQIWFFDRIPDDELKSYIAKHKPDTTNLEELASLADGSLAHIDELAKHIELWREISARLSDIHYGDLTCATAWSADIAKNKEHLPLILHFMRIYCRREMHRSTEESAKHQWATALANLIVAERLIFDRYLGANYVLNFVLTTLASNTTSLRLTHSQGLIERAVV